jgi:hypothetical protein
MLFLAFLLGSVCSVHAVSENDGCFVKTNDPRLSTSVCGCRLDYIKSFKLTTDIFPVDEKINMSLFVIPKRVLTVLSVRLDNITITFDGVSIPIHNPLDLWNLCTLDDEALRCPLAANGQL